LLIDNFDSFTWNLYQALCLLGTSVVVIRNDAIAVDDFPELKIRSLIVSPGPGHPKTDSGISRDAIKFFAGKVPILGVCMGLECFVDAFGGDISYVFLLCLFLSLSLSACVICWITYRSTFRYAGEIMHGKVSRVRHDGRGCFKDLPQGVKSIRYHSLSANIDTLPEELAITAVTEENGIIMGVRHRKYTIEAVQYHPESVLSESADLLFSNFLALKGGLWEENPASRVFDDSIPLLNIESIKQAPVSSPASKVPSILEKIYAQRSKDVEQAKSTPGTSQADLDTLLSMSLAPPLISFVSRIKSRTPALMAEIKRASPSKGPIALSANAAQQALTYALSGASVISVLTEPTWFKGSLLDMRLARQAIDSLPNRPAILRKEFILDEYQIAEARLHGADTVLLIVAMLSATRLQALYAYSLTLGMEPLVEVNNAKEMEMAIALGAKVIGVNNRNLHSFDVDMGTTSRLVDMVKERDVVLCALSGITSSSDVRTYAEQGVRAVLVGEALMRAKDTKAFISDLLDWPEAKNDELSASTPLVKICGIRTEKEALEALEAGADMLGLMFVPNSKRAIGLERARNISAKIRMTRLKSEPKISSQPCSTDNEPWFTLQARRLKSAISSGAGPLLVGVFQNQPLEFILETVASVQLDIVQLHGTEPVEWSKYIPVPVIKVFHVDEDGRGLADIRRPGLSNFVLLDSVRESGGLSGGTGKVVDWNIAKSVVDAGEVGSLSYGSSDDDKQAKWMPIILAGGLTADNVREAVEKVRPWAVDVSGGVETADGLAKDPARVVSFIKAAKGR
jgi:anthranilate synthase / indole-3-glycerol phosphate synthase / phosphoribosylanthranilate isomerase